MKKPNGFSMIILIPIIVLVLAIAGVFAYKLYSEGTKTKASELPVEKSLPPLQGTGEKPATGYGTVKNPSPIAVPASPSGTLESSGSGQTELDTLLNESIDDNGPDFSSLDVDAQQL
jgi:hypothetical protein